ncbi:MULTISPECIES: hypothetical protein [unclassified Salinibacterium]|uniref:hypothetical protein n=1 Tax=unclassified Salinibacterium TaxID=2632331 RepID=UPI00141DE925|nr:MULTISPECIES: hypothetical protein [unclassified Salinibacterium]
MFVVQYLFWSLAVLASIGALVAIAFAIRIRRPQFALLALIPVGGGLLAAAFRLPLLPEPPVFGVLLALLIAAIGVLGGSPVTTYVLDLATREPVRRGAHGGILIRTDGTSEEREVMRGGTTIGYLERVALIGGIAVGHPEVAAAVIAIKGLGRFSELDSAAARERFIIGTLASLIWAGACAVLTMIAAG